MSATTAQTEASEAVEKYYTFKQVAEIARERGLAHVTENSVSNAAYRSGALRKTKICGHIYFKASDVEKWLQADNENA